MSRDERQLWAQAQERATGRKFCTTCQSLVSPAGGRKTHKFRWVCAGCLARRKAFQRGPTA